MEKGRIVILAAGTGNPYFTTDTAAALRAIELNCEVLLKATKVDGVYDADPMQVATARRFREVSYMRALTMSLGVMDATALSLCGENHLPIVVFDMHARGQMSGIVRGVPSGTLVHDMPAGQDFVWDSRE
jgi:uridylate kinase